MKQLLYSLINLLFGIDISELICERDSLQQKLEYTQNKLLDRDNNILRATKEHKLLARKYQKHETKLALLQKELVQAEMQNKALKYEAEMAKKQWQETEKSLSAKIDNLKKELELAEDQVKVLSESKLELTKQIEELTAETTALQESCNSVNSINRNLEAENSNLKRAATVQNKQSTDLTNSLEEANNKNSTLQKKVDKLHNQIAELQAEQEKAEAGIINEPKDGYVSTVDKKKSNAAEKEAEEYEKGKTTEGDEPKEINNKVEKETVDIDSTTKVDEKDNTKSTTVKTTANNTKKEIVSTTQKSTQLKNTQKLLDGTLIERNSINVGQRVTSAYKPEEAIFEYSGKFLFDLKKRNQEDADKFGHVFYPKLDTPVLKWHKSLSNVTSGVTEPLLIKALQKLTQLVPEIELHQNTSLSISNRNYSYRPDMVLVWKKHNLYIDVEVDEPYDIVSRKPIHYTGSGDYLRNLYFISQGWVVIRFSEEQVYKTADHCVAYIANILKEITKESVFDELIATHELDEQERWSFEKAQELEREKHRESYLNIEAVEQFKEASTSAIDSTPFAGVTPAVDILPENEEHTKYEQIINSKAKEYIRVTIWPMEYQRIYTKYKVKCENYRYHVYGYDVVEEKYSSVAFDSVMKIEPLDSPFKHPLFVHNYSENYSALKELLFEAIYNCNPIQMNYEDANNNITTRNITYISYHGSSTEHYCDNMWDRYYEVHLSKIHALCLLRGDARSFYDHRIKTLQIFNLKDIGIGHVLSFQTALWHPITKNDMEVAHRIVGLIPQHVKESDGFVVLAGNYAHYLLLTGKTDQALEIYKQHEGKQITVDMDWKQMNLIDFEALKDIADYSEKFDEAKQLLGWS